MCHSRKGEYMRRIFALLILALVALVAAGLGTAGREQQQLTCTGLGTVTVTVTTITNGRSVAWGGGRGWHWLRGSTVRLSGSASDLSARTVLESISLSQAKRRGYG